MPDETLEDRARRAVVELPVDCLTYEEIYGLRAGRDREAGRRDDGALVRAAIHVAAERRDARARAALDSIREELAAALSVAEVDRLLDVAFGAL